MLYPDIGNLSRTFRKSRCNNCAIKNQVVKMKKKRVYIAGLGLIGASLALGIKRDHPEVEILGYNRSPESRQIALDRGIVYQKLQKEISFLRILDSSPWHHTCPDRKSNRRGDM